MISKVFTCKETDKRFFASNYGYPNLIHMLVIFCLVWENVLIKDFKINCFPVSKAGSAYVSITHVLCTLGWSGKVQ